MTDNRIRFLTNSHQAPVPAELGTTMLAAGRLRWQAADLAGSTNAGIVRAVSELLESIAAATAADPGSVPASIQLAAARLTDQVHRLPLTPTHRSPD